MYSYEIKVGYSVTDSTLTMTIPAILDCFQDAATFEAQSSSVSMKYLESEHLVWFLSSWQIVIDRRPKLYEHIKVTTSPYDFKGFLGYRNFTVTGEDGNIIVRAASIWTLLDTVKMRPAKPTKVLLEGYEIMEKIDMDYAPRKIALLGEGTKTESFKVRKYQIDSNMHMNNVEYVKLAMETLDDMAEIRELRVEYKKSAHFGDVLTAFVSREENKRQVVLEDTAGETKAVLEFTEKINE